MLIAAIVMVIMSSGMLSHPIKPRTTPTASRLGTIVIKATVTDLKRIQNIPSSARTTIPKVNICDANRLCSILL